MPEDVTESAMICVTQGLPAGPVYGKTTHPAKGLALPMSNQLALIKSYKINPQKWMQWQIICLIWSATILNTWKLLSGIFFHFEEYPSIIKMPTRILSSKALK